MSDQASASTQIYAQTWCHVFFSVFSLLLWNCCWRPSEPCLGRHDTPFNTVTVKVIYLTLLHHCTLSCLCFRCKHFDPGDAGVQRLLLCPEYTGVQGGEGGQGRPFLLWGQLLCPRSHQDSRVQQRQHHCFLWVLILQPLMSFIKCPSVIIVFGKQSGQFSVSSAARLFRYGFILLSFPFTVLVSLCLFFRLQFKRRNYSCAPSGLRQIDFLPGWFFFQ